MAAPYSNLLQDLNWDEGFSIPIANDENKALENEIQEKQRSLNENRKALSDVNDRVDTVTDHLKNVKQELQHSQGLLDARRKDMEAEKHMSKIAERELGRLNAEMVRLQQLLAEIEDQKSTTTNNVFRINKTIDDMRTRMKWDQQALEAWLEESARKDEDAITLQKYTKQDEGIVADLTLKIERLTQERDNKHAQLDKWNTETMTAQVEMDRTAQDFRKVHKERQDLIKLWEQTIAQMQQRDRNIEMLAAQIARLKAQIASLTESREDKAKFLEREEQNNEELQRNIELNERKSSHLMQEYQKLEENTNLFKSDLDAKKRTMDRTAMDLEKTRATITQLKRDIQDKKDRLADIRAVYEVLNDKMKVANESQLSAKEYLAHMDEVLRQEELREREMKESLKKAEEFQFKTAEKAHMAREDERSAQVTLERIRAQLKNLTHKITELDSESLKQLEIIYRQDFQIQQLERRYNRLQGETSSEEKVQLEARIKELEGELNEYTDTYRLLNDQTKRLQDDMRRVRSTLEKSKHEREKLRMKMDEFNMHSETSGEHMRKLTKERQEVLVDENMLKLELKRLRDSLNQKADKVLSLEKRQLQLATVMKERRNDIRLHKDMVEQQIRQAEEERSQIRLEVAERVAKVGILQKKFEILTIAMAPPEGEEDRSQAYYVIKAAQEKEELQRKGDHLDASIRKAEKEINALSNCIRLMNGRNETYKNNYRKVGHTSEELAEKQQLEEQQRAAFDKCRYKRRQLRELAEDLEQMNGTLDNLIRDEMEASAAVEHKEKMVRTLQDDINEQEQKLERATRQIARLARDLRSAKKTPGRAPEEDDIDLRELREFNRTQFAAISKALQTLPLEFTEIVDSHFSQAGLSSIAAPPSQSSSRHSSRTSSRAGSIAGSISSLASAGGGGTSIRATPTAITIGGHLPSSARPSPIP